MPELRLQVAPRRKISQREVRRNTGTRLNPSKVDWDNLSYKEIISLIDKLVGPRPNLPEGLSKIQWSPQAMRVLAERYFLKDEYGKPIENVSEMCWRVAWELARAEAKFGKSKKEIVDYARRFYTILVNREFLPNSPTLMNAGKNNGMQYNGCFVIPVEDDLYSIFDGVKYQALIHQSGGGTGFSFSRLRPKGSRVRSTKGVASGPVSFMRVYNEATQQIKQGGTRRGANMGVLRIDHPDILEFIHCKEDGGITNFNISVTVTDKFMEALVKGEDYELIAPHTGEVVAKLSAPEVWDEIAKGAWRTGDPGLIFIDRINKSPANPIREKGWEIESTNPCGEQPLYPFDACNLGSIFLKYFVKDIDEKKEVDWEKLQSSVHTAVRMMDNVIEMNPIPLPQITQTVRKIRRIGLGVGGWADMLVQLGIPYDSEESLKLGEKIMKFINEEGHKASQDLAKERGAFPLWKESIYSKDKSIRNSTITTIAPTGTIGILADNSGGIEPLFAIAYRHIVKVEDRTLTFLNPMFEELAKKRGFYNEELMKRVAELGTIREIDEIPEDVRRVFGTAHEIEPAWHVKMQAAFQKYTDNAVSKTINLSHEATVADIKRAYMLSWETGCRGITVFRDGCKGDQVLNLGVKSQLPTTNHQPLVVQEAIKPRPIKVEGATYKIETPLGNAFITVNHDNDGNPFEVFVTIGKAGSEVAAMAEALGRLISTTLRFGNHMPPKERAREIMQQLHGIGGGRSIGFGPNRVRSLPDAISRAVGMHFGLIGYQAGEQPIGKDEAQLTIDGQTNGQTSRQIFASLLKDICPSCGEASLVFEEGCKKCYSCGFSEC